MICPWPGRAPTTTASQTANELAHMPKIIDKSARRSEVVSAALSVFAERGYHRATMQAIAGRAGLSKGSVYEAFESKESLLLACADALLTSIFEPAMTALEAGRAPIHERIETFAGDLLAALGQWSELGFSLFQVWAELGPDLEAPLRAQMAALYSRSTDRLQALLDEAVDKGEAAPHLSRPAALSIMAALDGMFLQAFLLPDEYRAGIQTGVFRRWCASIIPRPGEAGETAGTARQHGKRQRQEQDGK